MSGKKFYLERVLKICGYVFAVIFGLMFLVGMGVFIQSKVNPDQVPSIFGFKPFIVLSGSMESELYKGDLAVTQSVDTGTLEEGDIIAFRDNDKHVVTHRIVEIVKTDTGERFITKGDNNNSNDSETIKPEDIEGKYLYKLAGFGNIVLAIQNPLTLGFVLLLIVVLGGVWIFFGNNKLSKEERRELEKLRKEKEKRKEGG